MPKLNERRIFARARRIEAQDARSVYLQQACSGDQALLERLERLLRAYESGRLQLPAVPEVSFKLGAPEDAGTQIGPYTLIEKIGEGGFGAVFLAEQKEPVRRKVALKILKLGMDTREVVSRFEAERQALAIMEHPNIACVFDAGATGAGRPYFVMELVRGVPITQYCDEHQLSTRERLILIEAVCQAVQHAHQKGVIHRDLKSTNVLVAAYDGQPVPKIIDFGVAKALGERLTERTLLTSFGGIVGTLEYMSPEQAEFNARDVDTRADIYSLGVLLYELLTGTTPLTRERLKQTAMTEALRLIREEEPPKPSTRLSDSSRAPASISEQRKLEPQKSAREVRGDLDWIVMKALEKDRDRRYVTAYALARDIHRYLHDEPVEACPPSTAYRLRKFAQRNKAALATGLLISAALILGTATSCYFALKASARAHEADDARIRATAAEKDAREGEDRALQAERHARLREADALVGQAHGARYSRRPGQRFDALAALGKAANIGREFGQPPEWFGPLRNEAIAALALPDIHITYEFGVLPPGAVSVELNDDFTLYASATENGGCAVRRIRDDRQLCRLPELGEPVEVGFGPGELLAIRGRSGRFQLWNVSGNQAALRFEEQNVYCWHFRDWHFRNRGGLLALAHQDGGISVYDTEASARLYRLAPTEIIRDLRVKLHPTAPFLATCSYSKRVVQIRDLASGAVVATAMPPWSGNNGHCAWSPDGRTLVVSQGDGGQIQVYAFDPETGDSQPVRTLQAGMAQGCSCLLFHPDGHHLVSRGWSNHVTLFDVLSDQPSFSTHALAWAAGLRFDRSGERLAAARVGLHNDRIGLWSFAGGREYQNLIHAGNQEFTGRYANPTVHPGGRLAAIGLRDGVVLFDLETGRELAHIRAGNVNVEFDGVGNLLTNSFEGFFRWPVCPDPVNLGHLLVGPPEALPFHPGDGHIAASRDGQVVAQCMWNGYGMAQFAGGWILHPDAFAPRRVNAGKSTARCSVSPDGRWVAFNDDFHFAEVFETATGRSLRKWAAEPPNRSRFTPDGRWLITGVDNCRMYATGTWEPGPQLGAGEPSAATAELAVLAQTNGIYRLVELATGRELARLEDPEQTARPAVFTPDASKLIVAAKNGLAVWDLRRVRTELVKLGLDWDAPPYPPVKQTEAQPPLEVRVDLGFLTPAAIARAIGQAREYIRLSQWDEAAAEYAQADLLAQPLDDDAFAYACLFLIRGDSEGYRRFFLGMVERAAQTQSPSDFYVLARSCAMARESPVDPARAVEWANQVLASHQHSWCFHVLGLAQYRVGQFDEALQNLTRANVKSWTYSDLSWFGLALVHHRLGHADEARQSLDKGIQWLEREGPPSPEQPAKLTPQDWLEAQLLRAEAEEILELRRNP